MVFLELDEIIKMLINLSILLWDLNFSWLLASILTFCLLFFYLFLFLKFLFVDELVGLDEILDSLMFIEVIHRFHYSKPPFEISFLELRIKPKIWQNICIFDGFLDILEFLSFDVLRPDGVFYLVDAGDCFTFWARDLHGIGSDIFYVFFTVFLT